jgi:cytoskeletal protein RodZ
MEINPNSNASAGQGLPLGSGQKPGERLRQVRLSQKRDLADIARELNIPERQLVAIEADDYKSLPEPAFVKGYLRSYARLLGVDANALVVRFSDIYTSDTGRPSHHTLTDSPLRPLARLHRTSGRKRWKLLLWVFLLLLGLSIMYGLYAYLKRSQDDSQSTAAMTSQIAVEPTAEPTAASATTTTVQTTDAASVQVQTLPIAQASSTDRLEIKLGRNAEVLVKDGKGKTLLLGQQTTGQPLVIEGVSPFGITLPDATAVISLSLNGEAIDVKPYTVNGRAEFRLSR